MLEQVYDRRRRIMRKKERKETTCPLKTSPQQNLPRSIYTDQETESSFALLTSPWSRHLLSIYQRRPAKQRIEIPKVSSSNPYPKWEIMWTCAVWARRHSNIGIDVRARPLSKKWLDVWKQTSPSQWWRLTISRRRSEECKRIPCTP